MLNVSGSLALTLQKMLGAKRKQPGATACSLNKLILFVWSQASTGCLSFRSTVSWGTLNQSLYTRLTNRKHRIAQAISLYLFPMVILDSKKSSAVPPFLLFGPISNPCS